MIVNPCCEIFSTSVDLPGHLWLTSAMRTNSISKQDAIAAYDGNQAALAKDLGISRQAVHKLPDGPVPEVWELKLRYELKPEIFGMKAA